MIDSVEFIGPCDCIKCGNRLRIIEVDVNQLTVTKIGIIDDIINDSNTVVGICDTCNEKYELDKKGFSLYRYDRNIEKFLQRIKRDNPFGKMED